jgi:hypothetical protein
MNDGQFAEFAGEGGVIEANFQPIPLGAFLPTFEPSPKEGIAAPGANGNPEKYSREQSEKAYRYCEARRIEGKDVDYMETLTLIREGKPLPE